MSVPESMRRFDARVSVLPEVVAKVSLEASGTAAAIAELLRRADVQAAMAKRPFAGVVIGCLPVVGGDEHDGTPGTASLLEKGAGR